MRRTGMDTYKVNRNFHWSQAKARLLSDLKTLQKDPPAGVSGAPKNDDIMTWTAVIFGPAETEWEGGGFKLSLKFSESYPYEPPIVRFVCHMFHPNIATDGCICLDILEDRWNSCYDVAAILISIQSMLCDPNADNPVNVEAGEMFKYRKLEYKKRVLKLIEQSWIDDKKKYDPVSSLCSRLRKQLSISGYNGKF